MRWLLALVLVALFVPGTSWAQEGEAEEEPGRDKLAQTGFKFLSISVDARAAAMADAMTSAEMASSVAMFYNPAGMARLGSTVHASAGRTNWLGDIEYSLASLAFSPAQGRYGVFGLSILSVSYGDVIGTIRADNDQGYLDYTEIGLDNPSPSALAFGVGYAKALTDRFSVGGNVKYARQDLDEGVISAAEAGYNLMDNAMGTVAFDFGVLYRTGFRSLNLAMSARNFSRELTLVEENFELPLMLNIGVSMNLIDLTNLDRELHALRVAVEAERPRDYAEQLQVGGEYLFMNTLALRAGYTFPTDVEGVNLGVGVQRAFGGIGLGVDYAYTSFDVFEGVHRLALQFSL